MKIFVINLPGRIRSHDLEDLFRRYGDVDCATIWEDEEDGLRFAIVEMRHRRQGARAIRKLHRKRLHKKKFSGAQLWVEEAPHAFAVMQSMCVETTEIMKTQNSRFDYDDDDDL